MLAWMKLTSLGIFWNIDRGFLSDMYVDILEHIMLPPMVNAQNVPKNSYRLHCFVLTAYVVKEWVEGDKRGVMA